MMLNAGSTLIMPTSHALDPVEVWSTVEREQVMSIVGRGRRDGAAAARGAQARRLRRQLDVRARQRWSAAVGRDQGGVPRAAAEPAGQRLARLVRDRRAGVAPVRQGCGADRQVLPRPRRDRDQRGPLRGARRRTRGHRVARPVGSGAPRLPRRSREDREDVPDHRRRALFGARRPGDPPRRRRDRSAGARLAVHQLRWREDLRRGGRDVDRLAPRRGRRPGRAGDRASDGVRRSSRSCSSPRVRRRTAPRWSHTPGRPSRATSCRRTGCSSTRSCARRRARRTTAGRRRSPPSRPDTGRAQPDAPTRDPHTWRRTGDIRPSTPDRGLAHPPSGDELVDIRPFHRQIDAVRGAADRVAIPADGTDRLRHDRGWPAPPSTRWSLWRSRARATMGSSPSPTRRRSGSPGPSSARRSGGAVGAGSGAGCSWHRRRREPGTSGSCSPSPRAAGWRRTAAPPACTGWTASATHRSR